MPLYSELRARPRLDLVAHSPLPCPLTLYVDPTSFCNFKCVQCPVGQDEYDIERSTMRIETFERICREVLEMGKLKSLKLYLQGEPMLHPQLGEFVMIAKRCAERVEITSNCSVLSIHKAASLIYGGLDYLQVSVYGSNEAEHAAVTHSPISAARIRNNVKDLRKLRDSLDKENPFIYAKAFRKSAGEDAAFLREWEPIADECGFDEPHNWDGQFNLRERLYGIAEEPKVSDIPCPFPFYTLAVKADGKVSVCCVDWSNGTEVGNVHDESIAEIWRGKRLHDFRMMHLERRRGLNPACRNCQIPERMPDKMDGLDSQAFAARSGK